MDDSDTTTPETTDVMELALDFVIAHSFTENSAEIKFQLSDEEAGDAMLYFGTSVDDLDLLAIDSSESEVYHNFLLEDLTPGTVYFIQVMTADMESRIYSLSFEGDSTS